MKKRLEEALHEVRLIKGFLLWSRAVKVDTLARRTFSHLVVRVIEFHPQCHAQQKVIGELALSRQAYEEILSAKNKELEVTKVSHNSHAIIYL